MHRSVCRNRTVRMMLSVCAVVFAVYIVGCTNEMHDSSLINPLAATQISNLEKHGVPSLSQVILDANTSGYSAQNIDANLENAWGIAVTPTGKIWISANHSGLSVIYDSNGVTQRPPVTIPSEGSSTGGAPTGVIFNSTTDFVIPSTGEVSRFIFASEDGIISAWSSGSGAVNVADRSASGAVYKGIAFAYQDGHPFLYATNFRKSAVDVFDEKFQYVPTVTFSDPGIPAGYGPFGIQAIGGNLFVTYAKLLGPDSVDDEKGLGNGYVDVYRPNGKLLVRFASRGTLNSPWGIVQVPGEGLGEFKSAILIGNFGDGRINVFSKEGQFIGQLSDQKKNPITIEGLWGLSFGVAGIMTENDIHKGGDNHDGDHGKHDNRNDPMSMGQMNRLFFTAGPNDENDGEFGYLTNLH